LCLLLMGFAGASYGAVRFDVVSSPTEVINTGLSEVTGSINLVVRGPGYVAGVNPPGNLTGTSTGGNAQIGIIYNAGGTFMPIDNTVGTGIVIFWTAGFGTANPSILSVGNISQSNICAGQLTLNLLPGATPGDGDFIRVEGVRGRIAATAAATPLTDLSVSLQSINDPAANTFTPDVVRVAKSFTAMDAFIKQDTIGLLLCFPTLGRWAGGVAPTHSITITEKFPRAFVDYAANTISATTPGNGIGDRVDSGGQTGLFKPGTTAGVAATAGALGLPNNSTQFTVQLSAIPASVASITWSDSAAFTLANGNTSYLRYVSKASDGAGNATAIYSYETTNQTSASDLVIESFTIQPQFFLTSGATATGTILAAVTLSPNFGSSACQVPKASSLDVQPRFSLVSQATKVGGTGVPAAVGGGDAPLPLISIIRCNCYMLFTYVTTAAGYNTGIVVANTSQDSAAFGAQGAPTQTGGVTFYFYSASQGYRGSYTTADVPFGTSYIALVSQMLNAPDPDGTVRMKDTTFQGYIIAKAQFQYCHAISYIADAAFAATAQGYAALIIPDPAIKGGFRFPGDAGDIANVLPAGEGLNN